MTVTRRPFTLAAILAANAILETRKARAANNAAVHRLLASRLPQARALYTRGRAVQARHNRRGRTKAAQADMPDFLRWLIQLLMDALGALFDRLQNREITPTTWANQVQTQLADYHLAAFMAGQGTADVPDAALEKIADQVGAQIGYLNNFKAEVQSAAQFQAGWNARAQSYANSVKQPYWFGATSMLPLPAMPAQGTQCLNNCLCQWEIQWLNEANQDADAYWRRNAKDSCQTCLEREAQWSPVQIRNGVLL